MEYSINKLSKLAGISTRTLRYYDEIGLLKPKRISSSGYRIYGKDEVELLQHILFFKELGFDLQTIKQIIADPNFDKKQALLSHREKLLERQKQIEMLIQNVNKTLDNLERRTEMTDTERFMGFKKEKLNENDQKYGEEIRNKYGDETVKKANQKFMNLTEEEFLEQEQLSQTILETLKAAYKTGDPNSELAQSCAKMHKKWLMYFWDHYSPEMHANLAKMYVDDERFTAFYDKEQPGLAKFLCEAIQIYTNQKKNLDDQVLLCIS